MTAPAGDPAYKPATWKPTYQVRQFGVAGPVSIYNALANPPTAMTTAVQKPSVPTGLTPPQNEPTPPYN